MNFVLETGNIRLRDICTNWYMKFALEHFMQYLLRVFWNQISTIAFHSKYPSIVLQWNWYKWILSFFFLDIYIHDTCTIWFLGNLYYIDVSMKFALMDLMKLNLERCVHGICTSRFYKIHSTDMCPWDLHTNDLLVLS